MTDHQREELKRNIETIRQKNREIEALRIQIAELEAESRSKKTPPTPAEAMADFLILQILEANQQEAAEAASKERAALRKLVPPTPPRIQLDPESDPESNWFPTPRVKSITIHNRFVILEVDSEGTTTIHLAETWGESREIRKGIESRSNVLKAVMNV